MVLCDPVDSGYIATQTTPPGDRPGRHLTGTVVVRL
jgi:hypothetical protein